MKHPLNFYFLTLILLTTIDGFGQINKLNSQIDSLKYLNDDPFDCNSVTWRIISNRKDAIQLLIDRLADTTFTAAKDKCKNGNLKVGDIAFLTLNHILRLPISIVIKRQTDVFENGCQPGVFEYIENNRVKFKEQVQEYYDKKKHNLKWLDFDKSHLTTCYIESMILGHYE